MGAWLHPHKSERCKRAVLLMIPIIWPTCSWWWVWKMILDSLHAYDNTAVVMHSRCDSICNFVLIQICVCINNKNHNLINSFWYLCVHTFMEYICISECIVKIEWDNETKHTHTKNDVARNKVMRAAIKWTPLSLSTCANGVFVTAQCAHSHARLLYLHEIRVYHNYSNVFYQHYITKYTL